MPLTVPPEVATWGPAGIMLALVLGGILVTKGHADEIRGQRDRALVSEAAAISGWREQTSIGEKMLDTLKDLQDELRLLRSRVP